MRRASPALVRIFRSVPLSECISADLHFSACFAWIHSRTAALQFTAALEQLVAEEAQDLNSRTVADGQHRKPGSGGCQAPFGLLWVAQVSHGLEIAV
jgi:hypothetical protein